MSKAVTYDDDGGVEEGGDDGHKPDDNEGEDLVAVPADGACNLCLKVLKREEVMHYMNMSTMKGKAW